MTQWLRDTITIPKEDWDRATHDLVQEARAAGWTPERFAKAYEETLALLLVVPDEVLDGLDSPGRKSFEKAATEENMAFVAEQLKTGSIVTREWRRDTGEVVITLSYEPGRVPGTVTWEWEVRMNVVSGRHRPTRSDA